MGTRSEPSIFKSSAWFDFWAARGCLMQYILVRRLDPLLLNLNIISVQCTLGFLTTFEFQKHYKQIRTVTIYFRQFFLGRHSLMAGLRIPFQFLEKGFAHTFGHLVPFFSFASFLKRSHQRLPGVTRGSPGETGGDWGRLLAHCWA